MVVKGIAIEPDTVTEINGEKKKWPGSELKKAYHTLEDAPVEVAGLLSGDAGIVRNASYVANKGVMFEAEIVDEDVADSIESGESGILPSIAHKEEEELPVSDSGIFRMEDLEFVSLRVGVLDEKMDGVPGIQRTKRL